MSRKDILRAALTRGGSELAAVNSATIGRDADAGASAPLRDQTPNPLVGAAKLSSPVRAGAVGAMSRSLGQIANAAEQARALITSGASVVELPAHKLEPSFVVDRLAYEGPDFEELFRAIQETGQRSPILVRPHPDKPGYYQIAFGHRRVRVLAKLGRPVKAVVQDLSDEELVVIQGQENSARADLSFIERCLFALTLEERGYDRSVIMAALRIDKTQLSKMLAIVKGLPLNIVEAIGPARSAGRPRWAAMVDRLSVSGASGVAEAEISSDAFRALDSDARFLKLMGRLNELGAPQKPSRVSINGDDGEPIAQLETTASRVTLMIDRDGQPKFGEFVANELPRLYRQFRLSLAEDDRHNE